ncbi:hypothetical protein D3C86_1512380 [compost metagenome]
MLHAGCEGKGRVPVQVRVVPLREPHGLGLPARHPTDPEGARVAEFGDLVDLAIASARVGGDAEVAEAVPEPGEAQLPIGLAPGIAILALEVEAQGRARTLPHQGNEQIVPAADGGQADAAAQPGSVLVPGLSAGRCSVEGEEQCRGNGKVDPGWCHVFSVVVGCLNHHSLGAPIVQVSERAWSL